MANACVAFNSSKVTKITQRVNNIKKKKKENIDVKSCADARRLRHAR